MWSQTEDAAQLIMKHSSILSQAKEKKNLSAPARATSRHVARVIIAEKKLPLRENYTVDRGIRKNMRHFISLSPPPPCVAARSQILQIAKLCATPLCGFPAIRAYLGFLK